MNKILPTIFENPNEKKLFLEYYKKILNSLDLPFKIEEGKVLRKYPDLWTLKQIYKIKNRKHNSIELSTA